MDTEVSLWWAVPHALYDAGRRWAFGHRERGHADAIPKQQLPSPNVSPQRVDSPAQKRPVHAIDATQRSVWRQRPPLELPPPEGLWAIGRHWQAFWDFAAARFWDQFSPRKLLVDSLAALAALVGRFRPEAAGALPRVAVRPLSVLPKPVVRLDPNDERDYPGAFASAIAAVLPDDQGPASKALGKLIAGSVLNATEEVPVGLLLRAVYAPEALAERLARLLTTLSAEFPSLSSVREGLVVEAVNYIDAALPLAIQGRKEGWSEEEFKRALDEKHLLSPSLQSSTDLGARLCKHLRPVADRLENEQDQALLRFALFMIAKQPEKLDEAIGKIAHQTLGREMIDAHFGELIRVIDQGVPEKSGADGAKHEVHPVLTDAENKAVGRLMNALLSHACGRPDLAKIVSAVEEIDAVNDFVRGLIDKGLSLFFRGDKLNLNPLVPALEVAAKKALLPKGKRSPVLRQSNLDEFFERDPTKLEGLWKTLEYVDGFLGIKWLHSVTWGYPLFLENLLRRLIENAVVQLFPVKEDEDSAR